MRFRHKSLILLLMAAAAWCGTPQAFGSVQPVHAQHGIVVSVHELASQAGVENDAGRRQCGGCRGWLPASRWRWFIPRRGNIGGGGFMLIRMADGKTHFLDYREKAPAAATRDMYLDAQGNVIEGASEYGYKAIGVPGSVAGMVIAEQKYGKLTLAAGMAPAIRLAREGLCAELGGRRAIFGGDKYLAKFAESRRIFSARWQLLSAGGYFRQPDLARTLERIAAKPDDFYHGRWRANWPLPCRKAEA